MLPRTAGSWVCIYSTLRKNIKTFLVSSMPGVDYVRHSVFLPLVGVVRLVECCHSGAVTCICWLLSVHLFTFTLVMWAYWCLSCKLVFFSYGKFSWIASLVSYLSIFSILSFQNSSYLDVGLPDWFSVIFFSLVFFIFLSFFSSWIFSQLYFSFILRFSFMTHFLFF